MSRKTIRPPSFQEMLLALERFWAERGCVIAQPYSSEVGAGTFNPATFLRALGPEPWQLATSALLHGNFAALLSVLVTFWFFASAVEVENLDLQIAARHGAAAR